MLYESEHVRFDQQQVAIQNILSENSSHMTPQVPTSFVISWRYKINTPISRSRYARQIRGAGTSYFQPLGYE